MVEREGFEPSKAKAARFTVWSRWPLGYLSTFFSAHRRVDSHPNYRERDLTNLRVTGDSLRNARVQR
jgi:hypothetical protein